MLYARAPRLLRRIAAMAQPHFSLAATCGRTLIFSSLAHAQRTPRQLWSSSRVLSTTAVPTNSPSTNAGSAPQPPPLSHSVAPPATPTPAPAASSTPTQPATSSTPPPSSPPPPPPSPSPPSFSSSSSSSSSSSRGPISWKSFALMAIGGGLLLSYYHYERERKQTAFQPVVTIGRAAIGGPFSLVSADGEPTTSASLAGRYLMLYFGFTHCPDICPTELRKMEEALALYAQHFPQHPITPIFISIDPHRDTPERLRAYRRQWSPSFLFLTGNADEIKAVAKSYRVYYSAPEGEGDDYLVDHSIFFYLLDRQGEVMDYFGKNLTADEIARKLCQIIPQDNAAAAQRTSQ